MILKWARSDRWRAAIAAAVAAVLPAACAALEPATEVGGGPASPAPITAELAEVTFDSAWIQIASTYYDSTFRGLDWDSVGAELRPRAAEARTNPELRAVLADMLGRLGDSHFGVIPGEYSEVVLPDGTGSLAGGVGMDVRFVEDELVVVRVAPGGPAAATGVKAGWAITSAARERVSDWTEATAAIEGTGSGPRPKTVWLGAPCSRSSARQARRWRSSSWTATIIPCALPWSAGAASSSGRADWSGQPAHHIRRGRVRSPLPGRGLRRFRPVQRLDGAAGRACASRCGRTVRMRWVHAGHAR